MRSTARRAAGALALTAAVAVAAASCGTGESGTREGAADEALERVDSATGVTYDPDTLAWLQAGRTVSFQDRQWIPEGGPVYRPSVVPVGDFEGMRLFAPADEAEPYTRLYFPIGDDRWQGLVPATPLGDTTAAPAGAAPEGGPTP